MTRFRSRHILAAAAAVLALATGACEPADNLLPPEFQVPLFEVESRGGNFLPGTQTAGYYVDAEGRVVRYNHNPTDEALGDSVLTPDQLQRKYATGRTVLKTLSPGEVSQRHQTVPAALAGPLAELKTVCADAGVLKFSAWVHNNVDGKYHRVLLHQRGDVATTRQTAAARALWQWLDELGEDNFTGCDPYAA
ncbi:MAG TPA: hypothetical protein VGB15_07495 [Longimicrobium sp.]|jgi:hypothetical protein